MSRKKVFKTAEEAEEYLFSEELESEIIVLPPEVDELTNEEGFDDTETLDPSPCLVNNYNKNMGGVDSHDWLLEKHTITRIVDMAVVNTCVIYNMVNAEKRNIK
ncbi:hypothetical protein NPIL_328301 [Nephila pilipes]|uniref:Uncharacterized protein n=1 Tax=Nephila pilipes TaxID=299642 RepID=A0A8X6TQ93_NEPPI|nr:hypothetical protein NPIL_328301 [Nephila pilipes]